MKKLFLLALMTLACVVGRAQYNPYYNPYMYSAIGLENLETAKLNNIRFDTAVLKRNPEAWNEYLSFSDRDAKYARKRKTYNIVAYSGLGVECLSLVPMYIALISDYDDPREDNAWVWSIGLGSIGFIGMTVGFLGNSIYNNKMKINKKDFIYYLKTTNNGVGIVTIF